jgi:AraC-like DNA-binding protein
MNLLHELLLASAAQGVLLSAVILSLRSSNPIPNRFLACFIGLESLHLFFLYLAYAPGFMSPPLSVRILFGLRVLDAPALYLYVRAMTEYPFRFERKLFAHFWVLLPVTAGFAFMTTVPGWLEMPVRDLQHQRSTVFWSMYHSLVFVGYGAVALTRLNHYLRRLEQALSSIESVSLLWLRRLIAAVIAAHLAHLAFDLLRLAGGLGPEPKILLNLGATVAIIYWLAIGGLRQQAIFTESVRAALAGIDKPAVADAEPPNENGKYAKSGLHEQRIAQIWAQLQQLLATERPHLDPGLDLPKLAKRLGLRPQELSQVLNSHSGGSFYELINCRRVEEAKALLREPDGRRRKMLDIAQSVGFSSQSTFYSQFKKITGATPTAYRDAHQESTGKALLSSPLS